jgi:hypothetical protein
MNTKKHFMNKSSCMDSGPESITVLGRRNFLKYLAVANGAGWTVSYSDALAEAIKASSRHGGEIDFQLSRFLMKRDYPRLEVRTKAYRFVWHGRWLGFRLCGQPEVFDERISYVSFGSFQVGGPDLLGAFQYRIKPVWEDGTPAGLERLIGELFVTDEAARSGEYLVRYGDLLSIRLTLASEAPHVRLTMIPGKTDKTCRLLFPLTGHNVYPQTWQGKRAGAYFSRGLGMGLKVSGAAEGDVVVEGDGKGEAKLICRVPFDRETTWDLTVLDKSWVPGEGGGPAAPVASVRPERFVPVEVQTLPKWEPLVMQARNLEANRAGTRERVAGIYLTSPEGGHSLSAAPSGQMEAVEKRVLDEVIASGAFQAIGLSRDGRNFEALNERWLRLVERVHAAGLRAYMKPGDGEFHTLSHRSALASWAKACFETKPERQVDVVRLCWEAVLAAWQTADLCMVSRGRGYAEAMDWGELRGSLASEVADRFSRIIDAIRAHAPRVTVDLECGDTVVFEKLLARHENLRVMYMCYGPYPRVGEYLDLYAAAARRQFKSGGVVLETDCYYTARYDDLSKLHRQPLEGMYSEDEISNMADKHRHLNALSSEAAWAWGINVCNSRAKFDAICGAHSRAGLR